MKPLLLKTCAILICCSFITISSYAQKRSFKFTVLDSIDGKPLSNATIVLLRDKDSALMAFGITDTLGKFTFNNLKVTSANSFVVSFLGFFNVKVPIETNGKSEIHETVRLVPNAKLLNEVIVRSGTPIRMNKDSLEYNTSFFKTMPDAVTEELFKKLPGFDVRENGDVYVNGQKVSRILVDGKEFFSSDPKVLLKNLPAELIAKVQVVDEKNTIAKETREQLEIPKVINLKLKKEVHQGIIGKVFGGYGTKDRYEAGGLMNVFRDTLQVSLIGTSSNQSSSGFSRQDLNDLGGFSRSSEAGGQSSTDLNGYYYSGIPQKSAVGTNINYNFTKDKQLNVQYFYNNNNVYNQSQSHQQQFLADSILNNSGTSTGRNKDNGQKINSGFRWKQDSTGYFIASANISFGNSNNVSDRMSQSYSVNAPLLSASTASNANQSSTNAFGMRLEYQKTFVKPKIDISVNTAYNANKNNQNAYSNVVTQLISSGLIPDTVIQHKLQNLPGKSATVSLGANKSLNDQNMVGVTSSYNYSKVVNGGQVFQYDQVMAKDVFMPDLSQVLTQNRQGFDNGFFYRYTKKKGHLNVTIGSKLKYLFLTNQYNENNTNTLKRTYSIFSPELSLNYSNVSLSFNRSMDAPSSYYLSPIIDSSNKLYVTQGNPNLSPSTKNNLNLSYNKYWTKQQLFFVASFNGTFSSNVIVNRRTVSADGKTFQDYVNADHSKYLYGYINASKGFHKGEYNYNLNTSINLNLNYMPLYLNNSIGETRTTNIYANVGASWSYKSVLSFNGGYRINTSNAHNTDTTIKTNSTISNSFFVQSKWKPTRRLLLQWNNTLNNNPNASPGFPKTWLFSDASIAYSFMKKQQLQLRLSAYDIFNQNTGSYRNAYQNFISDYQTLVQKRYLMLTVTYSFKKLGQ